jgi:hypothetical protein
MRLIYAFDQGQWMTHLPPEMRPTTGPVHDFEAVMHELRRRGPVVAGDAVIERKFVPRKIRQTVLSRLRRDYRPRIVDVAVHGGFCFSMCLEWASDVVMGRNLDDFDPAAFRALSHTRAFTMAVESAWSGVAPKYDRDDPNRPRASERSNYMTPTEISKMKVSEPDYEWERSFQRDITTNYVRRYLSHQPIQMTCLTGVRNGSRVWFETKVSSLPLGSSMVVVLSGYKGTHAVCLAHGLSLFRYFDPNQGEFSAPSTDANKYPVAESSGIVSHREPDKSRSKAADIDRTGKAGMFAEEVMQNLASRYSEFLKPLDIDIYTLSRGGGPDRGPKPRRLSDD